MDPMTGAIVIAGLKYVGPPSAALVSGFVERVFGPAADATGDALAQPIRDWQHRRNKRAQRLMVEAAQIVDRQKLEPHPVPGRLLFPILEKSSVEEDERLCCHWVSLLASAAINPDAVPPSFPHILAELSPLDAQVLNRLHRATTESGKHPTRVGWMEIVKDLRIELPPSFSVPDGGGLVFDDFALAPTIHNLVRLQLIQSALTSYYALNDAILTNEWVHLTAFGSMFVRACSLQNST